MTTLPHLASLSSTNLSTTRRLARLAIMLLATTVAACTTSTEADMPDLGGGKADGEVPELELTMTQRETLVKEAATCPFMRAAVGLGLVRIRGTIDKPLGDTGDVVHLGNAGGGDLGKVLSFFAATNHNRMNGPGGTTTKAVPDGTFAIWFPGSRGAHPGHSGILMGDPSDVHSGRLSPEKLSRLTSQFSTLYPDGKRYISRAQFGDFIAQNVEADPSSRGFDFDAIVSVSSQVAELTARLLANEPNVLKDVLHLFVTGNDLINSSGEFALLVTRFADATDASGDPLISTDAVNALFRDGVFPAGWDSRPATSVGWVHNTLSIFKSAVLASWGI